MIIVFDSEVRDRLAAIEADEGIPQDELVRQAVAIWSQLTATERRQVGLVVMAVVMRRLRGGG